MNKIFTTLIASCVAVGAFAQGVQLTRPHAPEPQVSASSVSAKFDTSLLKALILFDKLDNSYMAINYEVAQLDGLFNAPLRLGVAGAQKSGTEYWTGPSITYGFINSQKLTMGLILAFPGVTFEGNDVKLGTNVRLIPGVSVSVRW